MRYKQTQLSPINIDKLSLKLYRNKKVGKNRITFCSPSVDYCASWTPYNPEVLKNLMRHKWLLNWSKYSSRTLYKVQKIFLKSFKIVLNLPIQFRQIIPNSAKCFSTDDLKSYSVSVFTYIYQVFKKLLTPAKCTEKSLFVSAFLPFGNSNSLFSLT